MYCSSTVGSKWYEQSRDKQSKNIILMSLIMSEMEFINYKKLKPITISSIKLLKWKNYVLLKY